MSTPANKLWPISSRLEFDGAATPVKTALFLIVCLAWLMPGLIGHDPWRTEEGVTFGLAYHILNTGDWVVPTVVGEPYLQTPPLYAMVAALCAKLFSPLLALHDAARLATGFFMAAAIACLAFTAHNLLGARFGRLSALLFIGSLGLLLRAHEMTPDVAVLAGLAFGLYALTLVKRNAALSAVLFGTALGLTFLAGGLAPMLMLLALALAMLTQREWRPSPLVPNALIVLLACAPWLIAWPVALWQSAPELSSKFWHGQWNSLVGVFDKDADPGYFLRNLLWYSWPSLPIVVASAWREKANLLRRPELRLPIIGTAIFVLVLTVVNDTRDAAMMPLLLPISLLAAAGVDSLRRSVASALDWFGMMTFGLFVVLLWLAWTGSVIGWPQRLAREVQDLAPGLSLQFHAIKALIAALLTVLWIAIIAHTRRSNRRAIVNWTAGITLFWLLLMILWLPAIDNARSYRATANSLRTALASEHSCVSGYGFTLSQRVLFDYLIGLRIKSINDVADAGCKYLLIHGTRAEMPQLSGHWVKTWEGARPADKRQRLSLYEHRG